MDDDLDEQLWVALQPEAARQVKRVRAAGTRFVHYTSAESGIAILRSNRMLLRNSALLNDFSEVQHGLACLTHAFQSSVGLRLQDMMRRVQTDLPEIFAGNFDQLALDLKSETYLLSISEHGDGLEDQFGRLSMWRAYANRNGIAFVFNNKPFVAENDVLHAYSSPVIYSTVDGYLTHFDEVVKGVEGAFEIIAQRGGANMHDLLTHAFRFAIQSVKHPAFEEEREWRVIYAPTMLLREGLMDEQQLKKVPTEIMTLGGVPQRVYSIPFQNHPEQDFMGATIPEILDRVLIGPSPDAYAIAQAFVAELSVCGVEDAHSKVQITHIPLRT